MVGNLKTFNCVFTAPYIIIWFQKYYVLRKCIYYVMNFYDGTEFYQKNTYIYLNK